MLDRLIDTWQRVAFARVLAVEHSSNHVLPRGQLHRMFGDSAITIYRAGDPEFKALISKRPDS
jgi:hypothetical protein